MKNPAHPHVASPATACALRAFSRREFLFTAAKSVAIVSLATLPGHNLFAQGAGPKAKLAEYPRRKIGRISELRKGEPVLLQYPYPDVNCLLIKLGAIAGAGVGPENDIVCFTTICTHMGGPLQGTYKPDLQILGACPMHLTTFDLTRHGMVVSGHATESLPQIILETEGDDIFATGVMGLIYGYGSNLERSH